MPLFSAGPVAPSPRPPGTHVRFEDLGRCPRLARREQPTSARDVRPDDITVIAALGDSISAALVARASPDQELHAKRRLSANPLTVWSEYRGLSYPTGLDPGTISLASILSRYTNVTGGSMGHHLPASCPAKVCGLREQDGLNAAISGSVASGLKAQVSDWLIPRIRQMEIEEDAWKFVNVGIGGNDICSYCLTPDTDIPIDHAPKQFGKEIKEAVEHLRLHVPNLIVNIVGLFRISALYELKLRSHCTLPSPPLLPHIPSLAFECSCALLPTPAGDIARAKMDALAEAYNQAILGVIHQWEEEGDEKLGVIYQPGEAIDLDLWPGEGLSAVDCFHPSEEGQKRVGAGFWNRLTLNLEGKARPIEWEDEVMVRCLEEGDRFPVGKVTRR
ncbi:uncharacterized protein MKK02DRAFT_18674 [Dioszegia hungarica]|uniref:Uncharacterized protein n=1 Tax=Dioszegia hungarica TaxID=4972 RepID=A0AA38H312_9TREE|nr:uncharacterized protein MKK02DRAFT_18674 [Dioszegia hungarica]KAI9633160.1 hypothetical protein MKK02DRAFT_18674 [Dioszegia hungarica]